MATNEPDYESIEISDPYMFYSVFKDPVLCKQLLEIILELPIDHVEYIEGEHTIMPEFGAKSIRMDVYLADGKGTKYNVEMQKTNKYDLAQRSRYYLSSNDYDCIRSGVLYNKMNDSYVIFICQFDPFKCGLPVYTVTPHCKETGAEMPDGATRLFLNTTAWDDCKNPRLRAFLRYVLKGTIDGEPADVVFLQDVDDTVCTYRHQKEWRQNYMKYWNELNERYATGKEDGFVEGRAKGRAEVEEENRLLGERLRADGRGEEALDIFSSPERRALELEKYGIVVPSSNEAPAQ